MKASSQVVIIGGGVGGASVAYHLAELGWSDVVLLERATLTSGSTFHSAGLVGQLRSTVTLTRMMMYGVELYRRLRADPEGADPGWHEVGSLRLASSPERMEELQRQAGWAATVGLPLELLSTAEAHELFPLFEPAGVLGAAYLPTDGHLDPSGLTQALAKGARAGGAEIATGVAVTGIGVERGRVRRVDTDHGSIEAEVVVDAAGIWAHEVGRMAGVHVPVVPMAHQYAIVRPRQKVDPAVPTMRDPDRLVYFREEVGGLVVGGYEREPAPWGLDGIPGDFNDRLLPEDWDRFLPLSESATSLVPALADADVVQLVNGPEGFTPDGEFLLGESEVAGFFVAAGFCAHGIAGAGGNGRALAEWIVEGEPTMDLWRMDPRRFGAQSRSRRHALAGATEVYGTYYDIHYPNEERRAGRPLRTSPAYTRVASLGAVFGEKAGWERPNWFRSNEDPSLEHLRPRGWAGRHWSTAIPAEHAAARGAAALFDASSFAKLSVEGTGACALLQRLCANDVDRAVGSITYTSLLNRRGGIECDLTVSRLAEERFLLVTGTAFGSHDLGWIRRHSPDDGSVVVHDMTSSLACFGLWGPRARDVLSPLVDDDLSFPYLQARELAVVDVPCLALRVTYVGELGWELYPSSELGARLWDVLVMAGRSDGLVPGGYRAIDSLRLEKGYRAWSSDISPERDPLSAGLGFAVRMDKPGGFLGREALGDVVEAGPAERLRCLVLEDLSAVAMGGEPVRGEGEVLGRVTSGGQGYTVGESIAYAWLPAAFDVGTRLTVEVFGERVPATVSSEPRYDPSGARLRDD